MRLYIQLKSVHVPCHCSYYHSDTKRLFLFLLFSRWLRRISNGGLFATDGTRKATSLRMFWSRWGAPDPRRLHRWAKQDAALLSNYLTDFGCEHYICPLCRSGKVVANQPWTWTPRPQRWRPGWSPRVSLNCGWLEALWCLLRKQRLALCGFI